MPPIHLQLETLIQDLALLREEIAAFRFESHQEHQQLFRLPWEAAILERLTRAGPRPPAALPCGSESRCPRSREP